MFDWIKSFLSDIFGNFWGSLAAWAIKLLMGPFVFFVFGPMFRLAGYVTEKVLAQIKPALDDVGISLDGLAANSAVRVAGGVIINAATMGHIPGQSGVASFPWAGAPTKADTAGPGSFIDASMFDGLESFPHQKASRPDSQ